MTVALRQQGMVCNRKRVAKHRRQRRVKTTESQRSYCITANRLQREFSAERSNEKWIVDFTYIDTSESWFYLALLLDMFSRKMVDWAIDEHMEAVLVERTLRMAFAQQLAKGELLHHSDRGHPYARFSYQRLLASEDLNVSMSGKSASYSNALMESGIGTLKTECVDHRFPSRLFAQAKLSASLAGRYKRQRLHSGLSYLSPEQFERCYFQNIVYSILPGKAQYGVYKADHAAETGNVPPFVGLHITGPINKLKNEYWLDNENSAHWTDALDTSIQAINELTQTANPSLHIFNLAPSILMFGIGTKLWRFYQIGLYNWIGSGARPPYKRVINLSN